MNEKNLPDPSLGTVIPSNGNASDAVPAPRIYGWMVFPDGTYWAVERTRFHGLTMRQKHALQGRFWEAMQNRALLANLLAGQTFDGTRWSGGAGGHAPRPLPANTAMLHEVIIFQAPPTALRKQTR